MKRRSAEFFLCLLSVTLLVSCLKDTFGDIDYGTLHVRQSAFEMPCTGSLQVPVYEGSRRLDITLADTTLVAMTVRNYSEIYSNLWEKNQTASIHFNGLRRKGSTSVNIHDLRTNESVDFNLRLTDGYAPLLVTKSNHPDFTAQEPQMLLFIDGQFNVWLFHVYTLIPANKLKAGDLVSEGTVDFSGTGQETVMHIQLGTIDLDLSMKETSADVIASFFYMLGIDAQATTQVGDLPKNPVFKFQDTATGSTLEAELLSSLVIPEGLL